MALLSTSKFSWVDPIDEVSLYRKMMPMTSQQDAAEFLGKCIEICEKEFKNGNGDSENISSLTSIYSGNLTVTGKDSNDQVRFFHSAAGSESSGFSASFFMMLVLTFT